MNYIIKNPVKIGCYSQSKPFKTIQTAYKEVKADVMVNFQMFNMTTGVPCFVLKLDNKILANDGANYYGYGWNNKDKKLIFTTADNMHSFDNFAGCIGVVADGKVLKPKYPSEIGGSRGRTCIGLTKEGYIVIYCWPDKSSGACTLEALGSKMLALGCVNAVAYDGGGSTQLVSPAGIVNTSRAIQNFLYFNEKLNAEDCPFKEPTSTVKNGSSGVSAKWVQWYLRVNGYNLIVDGAFGNASTDALKDFQKKKNLEVDGVCGAQTRKVLKNIFNNNVSTTEPIIITPINEDKNKETCPYIEPTALLRLGSKGEGVKWLQWYLNKYGNSLVIDGDFGNKTFIALKSFQSKYKLTVDGICGLQTRSALKNNYDKPEVSKDLSIKEKFINYLENHLGDLYIYGSQGQDVTENLINWSASSYPQYTTKTRAGRMKKYLKDNPINKNNNEKLKAFDCSGLILYALEVAGYKTVDMTAAGIYNRLCTPITKDQLQPGDIVFTSGLDHVGAVVNNNKIIAAEGSDIGVVKTENLETRICKSIYGSKYGASEYYWKSNWTKFGRLNIF